MPDLNGLNNSLVFCFLIKLSDLKLSSSGKKCPNLAFPICEPYSEKEIIKSNETKENVRLRNYSGWLVSLLVSVT